MKLRSLLLVSCMLVVPALAMFSHLVPADLRAAARRTFAAATSAWLGTPAEAGVVTASAALPAGPGSLAAVIAPTSNLGRNPAEAGFQAATHAPTGSGVSPATVASPTPDVHALPMSAPQAGVQEPTTPALVSQLADRTRQLRDQQAKDRQRFEDSLTALGAVSIDCQPIPGPDGLYSSSCRVPIDASGQLQRVFQAVDHDPGSASAALLAQVTAWRQRMMPPPSGIGAKAEAIDPASATRFR